MQDQESWKEFLLRLLTGLSSTAQPDIQVKIAQTLLPILHKIELLTNAGKVGVLPEDLLQALTDNQEVARQIDQLRQQTRTE
jgi:E3 ubiquitin-protein ligase UBR4